MAMHGLIVDISKDKIILSAESNARSQRLGLWADPNPVYQSQYRHNKVILMNGELNTAKAVAVLNKYVLQQQCGNRMELQFFSEELQAQIEALSLASVRNELVTQLANLGKCLVMKSWWIVQPTQITQKWQ